MSTSEKDPTEYTYEAISTTYIDEMESEPKAVSDNQLAPQEQREAAAPRKKREETTPRGSGVPLQAEAVMEPYYVPKGTVPLNRGGQARVYECRIRGGNFPGSHPAIAKLYPLSKNTKETIRKIHEVNDAVKNLHHPHLAEIYADGITADHNYYMVVMRRYEPYDHFLEFESFGRNKRLFERMFTAEVNGLNDALFRLHRKRIYHSDIKPDNIMQYEDEDGMSHLVLIDFGAGVTGGEKHLNSESSVTATAVTRGYTAPELSNARKVKVSAVTDYYSFGFTMAELIAGRYPKLDEMNDTEEDQAYRGRNMESPYTYYGLLLPRQLPDYLARFFEGTIYSDVDRRERNQNRWVTAQVSKWLTAVKKGDYDAAREIPTGREILEQQKNTDRPRKAGSAQPQENAGGTPRTAAQPQVEIVVKYGEDRPVKIHSTEEMAMLFLDHWDETIENLLRNARWSRIFSRFGEDVSNLFDQVREEMQKNETKREEIFDQMIMETYLPARIREHQLRYRTRIFATSEEFGQTIYAMLLQEKKETEGKYRLPEPAGDGPKNLYQVIAEMFTSGTVERFFRNYPDAWDTGGSDISLVQRIASGFRKKNKTTIIEGLYRFSFRMQGAAWLNRDGKDFRENKDFLAYLRGLYETDPDQAFKIQRKCYTADEKLKIDYYAFLMEAQDTAVKPEASKRETLK